MNIKIILHLMPWEIDYALLTFSQLKKSKYYLPEDVNITIDSVLNLSPHLIDWDSSNLPKEYFITKYNNISKLLIDYNHNPKIIQDNIFYGHLDLQRECISSEIDYYINICPDIYFSEYSLLYLIESVKQIQDKYFVLTFQHRKLTDPSWDPTTDPDYLEIPYNRCNEVDIYDIRYNNKTRDSSVNLFKIDAPKFTGWFDLYSKNFFENISPVHDDWHGYGPWDWYTMILLSTLKDKINFSQYVLKGQTIGDYWIGPLNPINGFSGYYKDFIKLKNIPNQRQEFESKMMQYVNKGILMLKEKGII